MTDEIELVTPGFIIIAPVFVSLIILASSRNIVFPPTYKFLHLLAEDPKSKVSSVDGNTCSPIAENEAVAGANDKFPAPSDCNAPAASVTFNSVGVIELAAISVVS